MGRRQLQAGIAKTSVVSAADPRAAAAGIEILKAGGSSTDAGDRRPARPQCR